MSCLRATFKISGALKTSMHLKNVDVISADLTQINTNLNVLAGESILGDALYKIAQLEEIKVAINAALVAKGVAATDLMSEIPAQIALIGSI